MTSQAQARGTAARRSRPGVPGLSDASGETAVARARARASAQYSDPMLFLQGTCDALAMSDQMEPMCAALGARATLRLFADRDHSFHVPVRSGRTDAEVMNEVLDAFKAWVEGVIA